jgi:hypothetical protein
VQANSYQDISRLLRCIDTGRPVSVSNASPFLVAATNSDRKLSASAALLNGSFQRFPATCHRT